VHDLAVALPVVAVGEDEALAEEAGDVRVHEVLGVEAGAVEEHLPDHVHVRHAHVRPRAGPVHERLACSHARSLVSKKHNNPAKKAFERRRRTQYASHQVCDDRRRRTVERDPLAEVRLHHGNEVMVVDVQRDGGALAAEPLDLAEAPGEEPVVRRNLRVMAWGRQTRCTSALNAHDASTAATAAATIQATPMARGHCRAATSQSLSQSGLHVRAAE